MNRNTQLVIYKNLHNVIGMKVTDQKGRIITGPSWFDGVVIHKDVKENLAECPDNRGYFQFKKGRK